MKNKIRELKKIEDTMKILLNNKKKAYEDIEETVKNITDTITTFELKRQELKEQISEEAITLFKESNKEIKKFFGGIGVKEYEEINYDEEIAKKWCQEHDMFFEWNKKAFEKAVKGLNLNFVEINKEPKVTFPKEIKLEEN